MAIHAQTHSPPSCLQGVVHSLVVLPRAGAVSLVPLATAALGGARPQGEGRAGGGWGAVILSWPCMEHQQQAAPGGGRTASFGCLLAWMKLQSL
jgi:hypothetical protein